MGKFEKLLSRVLSGDSDANIPFDDLCQLLRRLGFEERTSGSHHSFRKSGVRAILTLQPDRGKAKRYQVRQVREIILEYNLGGEH
jgi:predicted RNA binding protein YcfA (HicA-like mRNA interferase family)